mmetsp:Transcript_25518/g.82220  ORF Transcript_25518/g.82220 Transcript_25518/m.82220 type:complete len:254 (-) Transcript_25518:104-865(-)|eukprot:CAMPEP_0196769000 /NCGR_PEP_ID=MMETSP1104-20130614/259_1 /TAXON_ID=33652 /ORGANISM="Cafeteria sp., Strain Caron Lab Isolate" /LENGTH=253 /DNA_ID=CAMNT_0042139083 /DNA_START=65 /DNA_END=826 /DNA_ORIENTATION=+
MSDAKNTKRSRKPTTHYEPDEAALPTKSSKVPTPEGSGTPLGELECVKAGIRSIGADEDLLVQLHMLLWGRKGAKASRKAGIKRFNGFAFAKDSEEYTKLVEKLNHFSGALLKELCTLVGLAHSGDKKSLATSAADFLLSPAETGAKPASRKRKGAKAAAGDKKRKRTPTAYILFSNAKRDEVRAAHPDWKVPDIGRELGRMWKAASDEEQQEFKDEAARLKEEAAAAAAKESSEEEANGDAAEAAEDEEDEE